MWIVCQFIARRRHDHRAFLIGVVYGVFDQGNSSLSSKRKIQNIEITLGTVHDRCCDVVGLADPVPTESPKSNDLGVWRNAGNTGERIPRFGRRYGRNSRSVTIRFSFLISRGVWIAINKLSALDWRRSINKIESNDVISVAVAVIINAIHITSLLDRKGIQGPIVIDILRVINCKLIFEVWVIDVKPSVNNADRDASVPAGNGPPIEHLCHAEMIQAISQEVFLSQDGRIIPGLTLETKLKIWMGVPNVRVLLPLAAQPTQRS